MLYDGKSAPTERAVPDRVWNQVRPLLGLPEYARDKFEQIVTEYLQNIERRNQVRAAPSLKDFILADLQKREFTFSCEVLRPRPTTSEEVVERSWRITFDDAVFFMTLGLYRSVYGRTWLERIFVTHLADVVESYTGERPNYGDKWLPTLIEVCAQIDPGITAGTIEGALRGPRKRLSR
jgi:hypothetical protein